MKRILLAGLSVLTLLSAAPLAEAKPVQEIRTASRYENPFDLQRLNPYDHPPAPATIRQWAMMDAMQSSPQPPAAVLPQQPIQSEPVVTPVTQPNSITGLLSPNHLVSLAYGGQFQSQGIPAAAGLANSHASGRVTAETLINAAISEGRLSSQVLSNSDYVNMVESKLADLNRG